MEFTAAALWINNTFSGMDNLILGLMDKLASVAGDFLTPLMKLLTLLGEKGIAMFLLAFILMLFPKTRRVGVCVFGAVCCGALITNIIVKDLVARPRPFESMAGFNASWKALGSPAEDGFSFPSGHVTALTAGMSALCFCKGRKFVLPTVLAVLLMAMSRCYLMAHFPSDVLAAMLVGVFSAFVAWVIAKFIFDYCEDNDDLPIFSFLLYFDPLGKIPGLGSIKDKSSALFTGKAPTRGGGKHGSGGGKHGAAPAKHSAPADKASGGLGNKLGSIVKSKGKADKGGKHSAPPAPTAPVAAPVTVSAEEETGTVAAEIPAADSVEAAEGTSRFSIMSGSISSMGAALKEKLPSRPKRETSDWNERWNQYRSRKPAGSTVHEPVEEISFSFDDFVSAEEPPKKEAPKAAAPLPEGDEDVKIAAPKAAEGDEDMKIVPAKTAPKAAPVSAPAAPAPVKPVKPVESEDIQLPDVELHDILSDKLTELLPEKPAAIQDIPVPAAPAAKRGSYRGKHEK